jgi:hypothetical protein
MRGAVNFMSLSSQYACKSQEQIEIEATIEERTGVKCLWIVLTSIWMMR